MAIAEVHPIETTPAWWGLPGGYHPRVYEIVTVGKLQRVSGVLKDDGHKPEGADRKPDMRFSITFSVDGDLTAVAHFLWLKLEAGEDLTDLYTFLV